MWCEKADSFPCDRGGAGRDDMCYGKRRNPVLWSRREEGHGPIDRIGAPFLWLQPPPLRMDINDLHPPDDYSHRFFIWHEWIQVRRRATSLARDSLTETLRGSQANGPLTSENVFDYFATSMFYDKQSNNQVLRMQTMHTGVPVNDEAAELRSVHIAPSCSQAFTDRRRL